jgi:hypothetical protein
VQRWSQRVIDLADGDPENGNFIVGSPLALAFATRGMARYCLGSPGWKDDLHHGLCMARDTDPISYSAVFVWSYGMGIIFGVVRPDDQVISENEDAVHIAQRSGDDLAVTFAQMALAITLVHRHNDADRDRGQKLLLEVSQVAQRRAHNLADLPLMEVFSAREDARHGDRDGVVPVMRTAIDDLIRGGQLLGWGIPAAGVLVETLLDRGTDEALAEAQAVMARLADAPAYDGLAIREVWLLKLRALLARAQDDPAVYRDYRDRYRKMANDLGFEGHIDWAEEML